MIRRRDKDELTLQQGRIVWATVRDTRGENEKDRPLVIITPTAEILPDKSVVAVAITTQVTHPLPAKFVELPWHQNKHAKTGLNKPCAAVCNWVVELHPSDIQNVAGVIPAAKLVEIIKRLPAAPKDKAP